MHVIEADGRVGEVTGWKSVLGVQTMYNLEVTQDHTYTIGDGQWIVHNSCLNGGTLDEDEALGGHTLSKHVNVSEDNTYLRATVNRPAGGASAFYSESMANESVQNALQNGTRVMDHGNIIVQGSSLKNVGYVYDMMGNRWEANTVKVVRIIYKDGISHSSSIVLCKSDALMNYC